MNAPPEANIASAPRKRLIICCDGTWMNSDDGYTKRLKGAQLQLPSNVTRISRAFRRQCTDGRLQIIYYQNGLGTGASPINHVTGGVLGKGISENIREVYSFICANYCDGDEIVLVGFSRGAFTARSVAGLISGIGLLTREGLEYFFPILKDVENWKVEGYEKDDMFPELPPFEGGKPRFGTKTTGEEYTKLLLQKGYTRTHEGRTESPPTAASRPILIRAVGVWDTVGSLGIPDVAWLTALGLPQSTKDYHFYDTCLSPRIEYAFHALALDEKRGPFSPAVWEEDHYHPAQKKKTILKQVWFPGAHADVGGGYEDQQMGDITLAWMADQLSSVGVEFKVDELLHLFRQGRAVYSAAHSASSSNPNPNGFLGWKRLLPTSFIPTPANPDGAPARAPSTVPWAQPPAFHPARPRCWALGQIHSSASLFFSLAGTAARSPGRYRRVDPRTGRDLPGAYLRGTNEMVHPCVRTRMANGGRGVDDRGPWAPDALRAWRLVRRRDCVGAGPKEKVAVDTDAPVWPDEREKAETGAAELEYRVPETKEGDEWVWEFVGEEEAGMERRIMPEEKIGFWERVLMGITVGLPEVDVYEIAETSPPTWPPRGG